MKPREFRYRPHIKWFQYGLVIFMVLFSIAPNILVAVTSAMKGELFVPAVISALIFSVMTLVLFWLFRTMSSTRVCVDDQGLRYVNYRKDFQVRFDEITGMKFPSIPYLGGWVKIQSHQPDIRLTVVLEELDELVLLIKEGLEGANNEAVCQRKKLYRFYKTAGIATQSWDRLYRFGLGIILTTVALVVLGMLGLETVWCDVEISLSLLFLGLAVTSAPLMALLFGELLAFIAFIRGCDEAKFSIPDRDRSRDWHHLVVGAGIYAALAAGGYAFLLMMGC